jgi:outer membrane protein assembly factor BamB
MLGIPLVIAALVGGIAAAGMTRVIHFSGSMVPRLARGEHDFDNSSTEQATEVDLTTTTPNDFPQFLGPERNGWIPGPPLLSDWKKTPPRLLWMRPIGAGWSAFAAVNGFAVTLEQRRDEEWVTCYEIDSGRQAWGHAIKARHENPLGGIGPRSTPTIFEGRVYALGATGVLRCLDGATGKLIWSDDLRQRYGLDAESEEAMVMWGRSASPLIVDRTVVVPGGGPAGKAKNLAAFDVESGKLAWEAENRTEEGALDQIAYASPALATLAGRRQILIVNESTASGHDATTGTRLWSHPWPGDSGGAASASQAVRVGENRVLLSKGYSGGAELIEISPAGSGEGLLVKTVWKIPRVLQTKFTNVVVYEDHAFGLSEGILECVELASGKRKWKKGRYGHGQILGVGELLLVLSEEGELNLVELNTRKLVEHGTAPALTGKTWNNLCLYGNRLLVRNGDEAACLELPVVAGR